jgi:hypothetical protein
MAVGTTLSLKRLGDRHIARQPDVMYDKNDIESCSQRFPSHTERDIDV